MREYYTKKDALDNINDDEYLYAKDHINNSGKNVKKLLTATLPEVIELLQNDNNIYEHYGYNDDSIKLFIDIDYDHK